MKRIVDVEAFLMGMKPAHYGNKSCPTTMKNIDKLKNYPYITEGIDIADDDYFLFFQNETKKNDFLYKLHDVVPRSPEFHELLGVTIGYPPKAAKFFSRCQQNEDLYDFSIAIHYGGVRCISHVDDLLENATWIWERYIEKEDMKILINTSFYPVVRYDTDRLNEIKRIQQKQLTAKVTQ